MLILKNLTIGPGREILCENINLSLDSSSYKKIAVVGQNGSGKSTLLKTITKEIEPLEGSVNSARERIGYIGQEPSFEEGLMVGEILEKHLENEWEDYKIDMVLDQVGLVEEMLIRSPEELSGGQRIRLKLAEILLADPTILLLDETSNHLDIDGLEWLENFIRGFNGSLILVSHDRHILNSSIDEIWELNASKKELVQYPGNYDYWISERTKKYEKEETNYNKILVEVESLRRWLKENEFHPKYRFSARVMRQKAKLAKYEKKLEEFKINRDLKIKFKSDTELKKKNRLIKYEVEEKRFGDKLILNGIEGKIYAGENVLLKGPNGSGKSTLIRILMGEDEDFGGSVVWKDEINIGFLRQKSTLDESKSVVENAYSKLHVDETEMWRILAHYHLKDLRDCVVSSLSGGQKKRLELAILLNQSLDILFLDEPTNHLDIFAQESIQEMIQESGIATVLVSHDRYLVEQIEFDEVIDLG